MKELGGKGRNDMIIHHGHFVVGTVHHGTIVQRCGGRKTIVFGGDDRQCGSSRRPGGGHGNEILYHSGIGLYDFMIDIRL